MSYTDDFLKALKKKGITIPQEEEVIGADEFTKEYLKARKEQEANIAPVASMPKTTVKEDDIAPVKDDKKLDFFQKSAIFEDGYQFGDVFSTTASTITDVSRGVLKGVGGLAEGLVDLVAYGAAGKADAFGNEKAAENIRNFAKKNLVESAGKNSKVLNAFGEYIDKTSVFGRTSRSISEGLGQVGAIILTGGAGAAAGLSTAGTTALTTLVMGGSGVGRGMSEAYEGGATDTEAATYGLIAGTADAVTELIFGGLGKTIKATGLSTGLSSADDMLAKKLSQKFSSQIAKNLTEYGIKAGAEGFEEVLAGTAQAIGKKLTYMSEEELSKIISDENLLEQFVVGAATSGVAQGVDLYNANKTKTDFITGYSQDEQSVIKKEVERRVAEAEKDGKELTKKEKAAIETEVESDMENGYLSTDSIEEVLGGETFNAYKADLDSEESLKKEYDALKAEYEPLYKMKNGEKSDEQIDRQAELKKQMDAIQEQLNGFKDGTKRTELKTKLSEEVFGKVNGSRLAESYFEKARRGQAFEADVTKYDAKQQATIQKAVDSGILNNTKRTHQLVDMIAKISADKGVLFDFTNNEKLKESGFAKDGSFVNGYVTKDGITLNVNSQKLLSSVVGHEITHILEGTDLYTEMQSVITEYAKSKGDYQSRYDAIAKLYEGVEGANVDAELTAELVGDYLFTDSDFIDHLSVNHRNVFQKIYDEVKYLLKVATAGSKEARELEKVKRAFEKVYKEGGKATETNGDADVKYSLRKEAPPKETGIAYKVFYVKDGKLYPPMVANPDGADTPMGVWLNADVGNAAPPSKTGRAQVKAGGKGTQGGSGSLAFRPGWHLGDLPRASQFDRVNPETGNKELFPENFVWAEVEYAKDVDYQEEAMSYGYTDNGKFRHAYAGLPRLPENGYYRYRTNPKPDTVPWIITGAMKVNRLMSDAEVNAILEKNGIPPVHRQGGDVGLEKFGFAEDGTVKYSLSDSDGNTLSKGQQEYFKDSKMRDENGNLKVMYHGSQKGGFYTFDPNYSDDGISLFFVDRNDVAMSYSSTSETYAPKTFKTADDMNSFFAEIGKDGYEVTEKDGTYTLYDDGDEVATSESLDELFEEFKDWEGVGYGDVNYKVYLNLKNPLVVDAKGNEWSEVPIPAEHLKGINESWDNPDPYGYIHETTTRGLAEYAKAKKYDGVIFKNIRDNGGYSNGSEGASTVAIAFDSNQVKSVANTDPTANPDIRYSLSSMANTFFGDENMSANDFMKRDYRETQGYKDYVEQNLNNLRQTRADFDEAAARKEIEDSISGIVKVAIAAKKAGYDILDDSTKRSKKDSKNRLLFSSLEPNSDYFTSNDISTICDKRKNFAEIYDDIVRAEEAKGVPEGKRFFDNVDNYFYLHKLMADKGLTQPCRQCYVESMRKNLAPMANAFLRLVRETNPDNLANDQLFHQSGKNKGGLKTSNASTREWVLSALTEYEMSVNDLSVEMLTTADGLAQLKIQAPMVYEAFNSFYGQSKPKMPKGATPFRFGELTALLTDEHGKIKKSLVDKINSTGGFRLQSYSDFQIQNFVDVLQVIHEAGTLGLSGHAYTKVPAFLDATDGTNLKRNISIFMYKDGSEWKLDRNDSFPYSLEEIYELVNADKTGNTGIIAVSQNEDMSAWIMANDNVGYGIPFHKSGMKMGTVRDTVVKEGGREIKGYSGTKDHTRQQTEVWARSSEDHKALTKVKNGINIYRFWDFDNKSNLSKNELIEKNVKAYIDACEEMGYLPKFREYVMNNGKVLENVLAYAKELGSVPQDATIADISFEYKGYTIPYGYHKFLGDHGMFTPDGKASPRQVLSLKDYDFDSAVKFFEDSETLRRNEILQQFANGEERQKYRDSNLTTEELAEIVNKKRKEIADSVVESEIAPTKNSLSRADEATVRRRPHGKYNVYGEDVALEAPVAPVAEDVAPVAETVQDAPVVDAEDDFDERFGSLTDDDAPPVTDAPVQEDGEKTIKTVKERLEAKLKNFQTELENIRRLREETKASYDEDIARLQDKAHKNQNSKAAKLDSAKVELAQNKLAHEEAMRSYDERIAQKQAEYDGKKNKDSKAANNLLRQIERLRRLKSDTEAEYTKRINDVSGRVTKGESNILQRIERLRRQRDNVDANFAKRISDLEAKIEKVQSSTYQTAMQRMSKQDEYKTWAENLIGDTTTWVDKKMGLSYQMNTLRRNLRDVVRDGKGNRDIAKADAIYDALQGKYNRDEAMLNREETRYKNKYAEMKITKAEDAYIQMLGELRHNPDTTLTEDVVKAYYEKHKNSIDTAKVEKAINLARADYDELLQRVNEVLREQGMKEIPYRKGYFPHFTEEKQGFLAKLFNWKTRDFEIPTSIAGITEEFNPNRSWQSFNKERKTDVTDYSFMQGFDAYAHGALDWIHHIDDLQRRRAVENYIRYTHSDDGVQAAIEKIRSNEEYDADEMQKQIDLVYAEAENPLNNFVTDLRTGTNLLAGKRSSRDRGMEQDTNRKIYSTMTNISSRVSSNMVVGSISSAITNFIPITQSWGQVSPLSSAKAIRDTIKSYIRDDGVVAKSDFLTNRLRQAENLYKTGWDKAIDKGAFLMEAIDDFTSNTVWRSKYAENISNGMSEAEAISDADQFAENVMAGRSRGNMPTIFHSKNPLAKAFTAFQLEVANQYSYMFKDMPQDVKADSKTKAEAIARITKGYAAMFIGAYVYNALTSKLTGRDAAFDPVGIIEDLLRDLGWIGDDDEEEPIEILGNLAENVVQEVPFVGGLMGGGRVPLSSVFPYDNPIKTITGTATDIADGDLENLTKEWLNPVYYLALPAGGGQLKKINEGIAMFSDDHPVAGSYTTSGSLRFPVEDNFWNRAQAMMFGQYSSKNAREYFDNGYAPLKEKQIEEYKEVDMDIQDYWKYREGLKGLKTVEDKVEYVDSLDLPLWKKNVLVNNLVDRKEPIDMADYDDYENLEEFDYAVKNPKKYSFLKENGVSFGKFVTSDKDTKEAWNWAYENQDKYRVSKAVTDDLVAYRQYAKDLNDIRADRENGKPISGSAKDKKIDYINSLDLDYGAKIILLKMEYPSDDDYNHDIIDYLNNRSDISFEEEVAILKELGFTVLTDGTVQWD